jgi:hypothetical protein
MRVVRWSAVFLLGAAAPLSAQNPECAPFSIVTRAANICNAAIDGARAFHPIAGLLTSGGSPILGAPAPLGGLGHFLVGVRVNGTHVVLPNLNYDGTTTTVGKSDALFFPSPVVEAAAGVFRGTSDGFLAVDLLGSAQLLPTGVADNLSVDSTATSIGSLALGLGGGVRLSVLDGRGVRPAVAISVMRRTVPRVQYGDVTTGSDYAFSANVKAWNVRATVGKRLSALSLAGGLGWDRYTGTATATLRDPTGLIGPVTLAKDLSAARTMAFANAGLDVRYFKLTGEAGYQFGRDEKLSTTFTDFDPSAGRFFAGVGLTFGL